MCIDDSLADNIIGTHAAEALRNRLDDIRAADSVNDLLAGSPEAGQHGGVDCHRVKLNDDAWLTFVPNHIKPCQDSFGCTDWSRVRRVRIVAVGRLK